MQYVYFTIAAIGLYLTADWLLRVIERHFGKRLEQREVIFFLLLTVLAVAVFTVIRSLNLV
jgi:hypothetical protein